MSDPDPIHAIHKIARQIEAGEQQALAGAPTEPKPPDSSMTVRNFIDAWLAIQTDVLQVNTDHGWFRPELDDAVRIALLHSELSEALEGLRHGNPPSDHIPAFSSLEEELADVVIRIMDIASVRDLRIADAVIEKLNFNRGRSYRHGGKQF